MMYRNGWTQWREMYRAYYIHRLKGAKGCPKPKN